MAGYEFVTEWLIDAPILPVWEAIYHSERWPQWWKGVVSVVPIDEGDAQGIGAKRRYVWRSALPYRLAFDMTTTRVEPPHLLEGNASGELEGAGRWTLQEGEGVTAVRYDWTVRATKPWMIWLAPIARPAFRWNHNVVMNWGREGLQRLLADGPNRIGH